MKEMYRYLSFLVCVKNLLFLLFFLTNHSNCTGVVDLREFFTNLIGIEEAKFNTDDDILKKTISFADSSSDPFFLNKTAPKIAILNNNNLTNLKYQAGYFEEMSLADLKNATKEIKPGGGLFNVIASESPVQNKKYLKYVDIAAMQTDPINKDAVFQVASNFNALEFTSSEGNEMHNISAYIYDRTQGPAASISAAPGTIYRQYYVYYDKEKNPIDWQQSFAQQINFLDKTTIPVKNGYVTITDKNIKNVQFDPIKEEDVSAIKIGFQGATQATFGYREGNKAADERSEKHIINQVFTAAIDFVSNPKDQKTESIAQAILQAAYEGTLRAALFKKKKKVFLTLIGGGVFKNDIRWIATRQYRHLEI